MAALESGIDLLERKLADASVSTQNVPQKERATSVIRKMLQNNEIRPHWSAFAEIIEINMHLENRDSPFWHRRVPAARERQLGWKPTLNLVFTPGSQYVQGSNPDAHPLSSDGHNIQYEVARLLVEYIRAEYGDARLPVLLTALSHRENWETLAPAIFDLSADEFEQKWHEYLARQYRT